MSDFTYCMVDLETLSQRVDAAVVSIGAVKFNIDNESTDPFYININPHSCKELGMSITQDTIDWWKKQKPEAMAAWRKDGVSPQEAADKFVDFLGDAKNLHVCANGVDFDLPILKNLLELTNHKCPWNWWNQIDVRTVYKLAGLKTSTAPRVGNYHTALDDCLSQIKWFKDIMRGTKDY